MSVYIEQRPEVTKGLGTHRDAVRVKFSDVTLALSLVEASWLAANIGRIMREVEREHPDLTLPTKGQLLDLQIGDKVLVRDDAGNEADYIVKASPWMLGHGQWVIGLRGISGGYSLDRVVRILEKATL